MVPSLKSRTNLKILKDLKQDIRSATRDTRNVPLQMFNEGSADSVAETESKPHKVRSKHNQTLEIEDKYSRINTGRETPFNIGRSNKNRPSSIMKTSDNYSKSPRQLDQSDRRYITNPVHKSLGNMKA